MLLACTACGGAAAPSAAPTATSAPGGSEPSTEPRAPATALPEALPEGSYRIALTRPERVGSRIHIQRSVRELSTTRVIRARRVVDEQRKQTSVRFVALAEALAVNAVGKATRTRFEIERFEADGPHGPEPVLPPRTVLTVQRGSKPQQKVTSSAGPLDARQLAAVKLVTTLDVSRVTDQQIFGSAEPRAIGESWPIAGDMARESLAGEGMATAGRVEGSTRLLGVRKVGDVECLEVLARIEVSGLDPKDMPEGSEVERGELQARMTGLYPIDHQLPLLEQHQSMTIEIVTRVPDPKAPKSGHVLVQVQSTREIDTLVDPR